MQNLPARLSQNGCPSKRRRMPIQLQTDACLSGTSCFQTAQNTKPAKSAKSAGGIH